MSDNTEDLPTPAAVSFHSTADGYRWPVLNLGTVEVSAHRADDGAVVVWVDTPDNPEPDGAVVRLNLNEGQVFGYPDAILGTEFSMQTGAWAARLANEARSVHADERPTPDDTPPAAMSRTEACGVLGNYAGWTTPPDDGDPFVMEVAIDQARHNIDEAAAQVAQAAAVLGLEPGKGRP